MTSIADVARQLGLSNSRSSGSTLYDFQQANNSMTNETSFTRIDALTYQGRRATSYVFLADGSSNFFQYKQVMVLDNGKTYSRFLNESDVYTSWVTNTSGSWNDKNVRDVRK